MKIRQPVRQIYQDNRPVYEALNTRVDDLFKRLCAQRKWHYESRIKELDSFALKIETGRVADPAAMEDFFACTIVVRNSTEVADAVTAILGDCEEAYRRPQNASIAGRASSFEFDDLRLFVKLKLAPELPPKPEFERIFEVQVRTFLFHAWQIATHDLSYKSDDVNWGRARIAFQVRAMLEQAEIAIRSAEQLALLDILSREDKETTELKRILTLVRASWPVEMLPKDQKRLAQNILAASQLIKVSTERLVEVVEAAVGRGEVSVDLTPYQSVLNWLLAAEEAKVRRFVTGNQSKTKLVVYEDATPPDWMQPPAARNVLLVSGR